MKSKPDATSAMPRSRSWPSLSAEDRFLCVVEASPTALVLAGQSGHIEMVNGHAERMFGYDRSELHGRPLELLLPERFREPHVNLRNGFLKDMSLRIMGEGRDLFGLRKNGSEFPLEIGLNPIDIDGVSMVLAGIIDVTARHEVEREKERHRLELARSNADLEEFAYAASHDLKAPLRAISHLVQWIHEDIGEAANPETLDNLKLLQGRVARMQMLLDGLLAYSRVRTHQFSGRGRRHRRGCARRRRHAGTAARLYRRLRGNDAGHPHASDPDPHGAGEFDQQRPEAS